MKMLRAAVFSFALLAVFGGVLVTGKPGVKAIGESCSTPNNTAGTCRILNECREILELVRLKNKPTQVTQYLRTCQCGTFVKTTPVVCCPNPATSARLSTGIATPVSHRNLRLINREGCGLAVVERIIGGEEAELNEFPWMATLNYQMDKRTMKHHTGQFRDECGGTLITPKYVLTAAHCINTRLKHVRLGEHDVRTDPDCVPTFAGENCAAPTQNFTIKRTKIHPQYHGRTFVNDIALIELNEPANITRDYVQVICLPVDGFVYDNRDITVAGWGITELNVTSPVLKKAHLPLVSMADCRAVFLAKGLIFHGQSLSDNQICAGGDGVNDTCSGDSGGPMKGLDKDTGKYTQYGIVSYGTRQCATEGVPAVYTAVHKYISWILDNITP